ncbi:class A beta-lactamase [Mycolicibacterium holsaticum]|uniref:class A beta-lactamase n=1 Tax=Mycolicibacterium holsaticum TaxID=152142 RepID=UPI001C7E0BA1|nr:class A beta-lactamase [Mycolicibacterium holsaticum]MDA4109862.1 beta-lactamase [Mycolicibacterium holsaticum DSM 44478 = JCM 12374]QZA10770.1 class A beta-lactamase [Mycolicibacterium holsaticum DSM 44478 = JCM 12374]UNC11731.1 class A beta-lactamase [Mycolicibacterium holsaticum DSM 44478 = JCM 12374]
MTRLSRRRILVGGLTLAAAAASTQKIALADPAPPIQDQIAALEHQQGALIGVFAVNLASGNAVAHRAQERFAMCSTFKAYAAARVLQMAEHGELSLEERVFVDPGDIVANSPVTEARAGGEVSLAELCRAALQRSDNTAANLLLTRIGGPQAITAFARSIGDPQSRLDRWETELNSAIPGDLRDTSTPEALGGGYRNLLAGDVLAPPQRSQLEDWMRANQTSSMRAGLPQGWTSADKTGSGDYGSTNDVGIAYGPDGQRILLALMTRSQASDPKAAGLRPLIGELARLVVPRVLV